MGDPLVAPALVSFAVNELLKVVIKNAHSAYRCQELCKVLANKLEEIEPIVTKLGQHAECVEWLMCFQIILESAKKLTNDCLEESRLDKTKRMLKFWHWKKLPSLLTKSIITIDKAVANTTLFTLDGNFQGLSQQVASNVGKIVGFVKQATPSLIVGVDDHFNKLKSSILQSYGRTDKPSYLGLQGSGGGGKTLLAQMLNNDHHIKRTYGEDSIVWITVGLDASVDDLYDRMGKSSILGSYNMQRMKSFHDKEDQRTLIIEAFSKKRILLILDDVCEKRYDGHDMMYWLDVAKAPGSATLITTRSKPVLRRIGAEVEVVLSLDDDDSWILFSSHAFVNEASSSIAIPEQLARAICKECKGLPLALTVIGCAMAVKESKDEWESALKDLQQPTPFLESNVDVQLFGCLQLSYNELKSDAARICFLYFAAFPEDHKIDVEGLINIWVEEELFGPNFGIEEAKRKAYDHLRVLAERSLIYWKEGEEVAFIHDILRDLALYIIDNAKFGECAYECLFYSDKASLAFPPRTRLVKVKRMSFMNCSISQWPEALQIACSKVRVFMFRSTTIMQGGGSLDLLKNMHDLRVLDLSRNSYISRTHLLSIWNLAHITTLKLSHCCSISKLPRSICNLKCLLELDLSSCDSLVELPESISNLKCLTRLDMSWCISLLGLPKSIGNLKCLTKLDLSWCKSLVGLPESIGNLKRLIELDLSHCEFLVGLPESIGNLKYLIELDLSYSSLLARLPESIGTLKCLTKLDLSYSSLLARLPESIGNLKCLTKLDLSWCRSLVGLSESIGNLKCLIKLDLSNCESLAGLPESIGNLKYLMKLDLSWCRSLVGLSESISNLKCLIELDLSHCESVARLPESIDNLKCLTKLDMLCCESLEGLPKSIGNLKCLTKLILIGCTSLAGLPKSIGNLKCLTKLLIGCKSLARLPKSIGNLKCLLELDLSYSSHLAGLPESIGNLKCLTKLDLSWCRSLVELPESISNLECLIKLDLSHCESLAGLPESIGNLKCLTKLDLSWCRSLVELPESIGNLECLIKLDLSHCESLAGLPESIGNLKCLMELEPSFC